MRPSFAGKSGVGPDVALDDAKVADGVRRGRELSGQEAFLAACSVEADVPAAPSGLSRQERRLLAMRHADGGQAAAQAGRPCGWRPCERTHRRLH